MDLLPNSELSALGTALQTAWSESLPDLSGEVLSAAAQFPYYIIVGGGFETRIECVAADYDGRYVAFVLSHGSEVGFAQTAGDFNRDADTGFSGLLATVSESYALYTLEQYRRAA